MNELFPLTLKSDVCNETSLYFRGGSLDGDCVKIQPRQQVSFDTFFNCFSYSKYKKYTSLGVINLKIFVQGEGTIKLHYSQLTDDIKEAFSKIDKMQNNNEKEIPEYPDVVIKSNLIKEFNFNNNQKQELELSFDINTLTGDGYVYFSIVSKSEIKVYGGGYYTDNIPVRNPHIAIGICTFKREKYVKANVERLNRFFDENPEYKEKIGVLIVDNGKTLEPLEGVEIIPNKNLGGSGGFTRAMIEAKKRGYTNVLLMDDDIEFDPNILKKTYTMVAYSNTDTLSVGGSMMRIDNQSYQYEMGSKWVNTYIRGVGRGFDVSKVVDILRNERDVILDYNAWWYMCIPLSFVGEYGLPLPFFIKSDDIEYGIRCCNHNICVMNGIGVWHENFEYKYSSELGYYEQRNELVVAALRAQKPSCKTVIKKMIRSVAKNLIYQRYDVITLIYRAYDDFFNGPDFFLNTDPEKLHIDLRKDLKQYTKQQLIEQGYNLDREYYTKKKISKFKMFITLDGYLLSNASYTKEEIENGRLIHLKESTPSLYYKAPWTIQYNNESDRGFVTHLNRKLMWKCIFKLIPESIRFIFKFRKTCSLYKKKEKELISEDVWNNFFE